MPQLNLLAHGSEDLVRRVESWGEPAYHGRQLAAWSYLQGVLALGAFRNLLQRFC